MSIVKPTNASLRPKPRISGLVPVPSDHPSMAVPPVAATPKQDTESTKAFVNDGRYVLLSDLPSTYLFYKFKELWIRPFTPNEARLIHMARVSGNLTYVVSAVAACISKKVSSLVIEDFEFCLYWLRMNSYPSKPFSVTWTCVNPVSPKVDIDETNDLPKAKKSKKKADKVPCNKENISIVGKSNLIIENLEPDFVLPENIQMPTMTIFEEIWETRKELELLNPIEEDYEERREELIGDIYLMDLAQWIPEGETLQNKLEILKGASDLTFQEELEKSIAKIPNFGVSEDLEVECMECGGDTRRRLSLDYLTFFP